MNFRRGRVREEPEINFIPLIDVMLVILIFLMATTTYSKFAELKIALPTATAEKQEAKTLEVEVTVAHNGVYTVNGKAVSYQSPESLAEAMRAEANGQEPVIVINADSATSHQSVVNVMEAARLAGFGKLTFATQTPN
ncbi:ExbD/TolR family protein [Chitinimonas taiwanensis]|uniref:ExbD/TolR family protein n=1 Tax=Chitinimonas taiwanensis TaxID=240412 RepID=UPI0035B3F8F9